MLPRRKAGAASCAKGAASGSALWASAAGLASVLLGGENRGGIFRRKSMTDKSTLHRLGTRQDALVVGDLYVKTVPPPDSNKNTSWFLYPGVWSIYIIIIFVTWLTIFSVFSVEAGSAWSIVNLIHAAVTYRCFHWKKGTPFAEDQGEYSMLTWWEQVDNGRQLTRNRKFLTVVPVVLYLIACHTTDYRMPWLIPNTIAVFVMEVAKVPNMHRVRIFGINSDSPT